ncbi:MAG: P-loop NTPase [Desulfobacterales bacterium]|nr:MAG: P-loop NTPase [Desulfobacterales bacterium]
MKPETFIIPVAGGKGGVGKTFFAANIAIAMAAMGHTVLAIDLDLGGSNLHSFFGLPNKYPGIGDFLKARSAELEDLMVATKIPNLQFIPGDGRTPFLANIPYAQKIRLISRIKRLPAEYIFLDLGSGTSFNTLDFFRISNHGFVITTFDYPSTISMMIFLKHLILRVIERSFAGDNQMRQLLKHFNKQSMTDGPTDIRTLQSRIASIDPEAEKTVKELCNMYRPRVVFNLGENPRDIKVADQISRGLESNVSVEVDYFGFIFDDLAVRQAVKKQIALLPHFQESLAGNCIMRIAERMVKYWNRPINNSSLHLLRRILEVTEN